MSKFFICLAILFYGSVFSASAKTPVLVELFATDNCLACPKAYKTLREVELERADVFVITWPVDYWDYLGNDDSMALAASMDRQAAYVERFGLRGPYTPQTVYDGRRQCAGNKRQRVETALRHVKKEAPDPGPVSMTRTADGILINGDVSRLSDVFLIEFLEGEANPTEMVRPVTSAKVISQWIGGPLQIDVSACQRTCLVVVQAAGHGEVLASLRMRP